MCTAVIFRTAQEQGTICRSAKLQAFCADVLRCRKWRIVRGSSLWLDTPPRRFVYQGLVALLNRFMDLWFALLMLVGVAAAALCCSCIGFAIYRIRHFGRAS